MRKPRTFGRRALVVTLALVAATSPLALAGCNGSDAGDDAPAAEQPAEEQTEQPAEEQTEQPAEEKASSKYVVTIDGSTVTTDYEGKPAIIVDYTFTNNSDDATSFAVACSQKAFQNGVQLETAVVLDDLGNGYLAEIKPGATTSARMAYSLADESDVTVEVTELISFDDTILAEATFPVA